MQYIIYVNLGFWVVKAGLEGLEGVMDKGGVVASFELESKVFSVLGVLVQSTSSQS